MTVQQGAARWDFDEWEEDAGADEDFIGPVVAVPDRATLAALPPPERRRIIEAYVRQEIARVLSVAPCTVETSGRTMSGLGVGSVAGLRIQSRIKTTLDVEVNLQMLLLANSAGDLIDCLVEEVGPGDPAHAERSRCPA